MWASSMTMKSMSLGLQLGQQIVGVLAGPERVEVGDDTSAASSSSRVTSRIGPLLAVEVLTCGRRTTGDQRPARQAIEDVADGLVVEGAVESAADDAAGRDDHRPPLGECERGATPSAVFPAPTDITQAACLPPPR